MKIIKHVVYDFHDRNYKEKFWLDETNLSPEPKILSDQKVFLGRDDHLYLYQRIPEEPCYRVVTQADYRHTLSMRTSTRRWYLVERKKFTFFPQVIQLFVEALPLLLLLTIIFLLCMVAKDMKF